MKKFLIILSIFTVITVMIFYGITVYKNSQQLMSAGVSIGNNQSEHLRNTQGVGIPQSGDPCDGTNGNGQIVGVGNNNFAIKVTHGKNNGSNQVVGITAKTSIRTSTGSASISALKIGEKVTVAGTKNPNGTFSAEIVAVCGN